MGKWSPSVSSIRTEYIWMEWLNISSCASEMHACESRLLHVSLRCLCILYIPCDSIPPTDGVEIFTRFVCCGRLMKWFEHVRARCFELCFLLKCVIQKFSIDWLFANALIQVMKRCGVNLAHAIAKVIYIEMCDTTCGGGFHGHLTRGKQMS